LNGSLQYLLFDASKDGAGTGTWEAMASVRAADLPAVLAEVQQVLAASGRHSRPARAVRRGRCGVLGQVLAFASSRLMASHTVMLMMTIGSRSRLSPDAIRSAWPATATATATAAAMT